MESALPVTVVRPSDPPTASSAEAANPAAESLWARQLENSTSVMCIVMTLVVMFALVVLLQTRMTDNSSFRDLMILRGVTMGRKRTGKFDLLEPDSAGDEGVNGTAAPACHCSRKEACCPSPSPVSASAEAGL
ncbi:hypothetical protein HPB48_019703 [Haemaphysalis longicornis]|uniref:Uncharacterized protein n=1 Tax=Haemaphysalis longicornis TaxID=44386 RepID=A0A9J6G228_HAELO|nr:hypothetical protein HPB48_019703 [Haemaphysalis longicornis]